MLDETLNAGDGYMRQILAVSATRSTTVPMRVAAAILEAEGARVEVGNLPSVQAIRTDKGLRHIADRL